MHDSCDVLVVGGGVIGLTLATELRTRLGSARVVLIEKEDACARHATGRNSGVLHAGFYYTEDSLKARYCREGNAAWREVAGEEGLALDDCGKLVVARDAAEDAVLDTLRARGVRNGVRVELIPAEEARRIEPRVRTFARALWSPTTASLDPGRAAEALVRRARRAGVEIRTGVRFLSARPPEVRTSAGPMETRFLVNAAGLHADAVARAYGYAERLRILPFKGLYLYQREGGPPLWTHVYPVPDLRNPFLGVHFTRTAAGRVKIGPTATPAFWREQYGWIRGFRAGEMARILAIEAGLLARNSFGFRSLAVQELRKYRRARLVEIASSLVADVRAGDFREWGPPGIRAQLVDLDRRALVQDFAVESDERSLHVLNAISPAWTCAIPMARDLAERVVEHLG